MSRMRIETTYGVDNTDILGAREALEKILGVPMAARDSWYVGGVYYVVETNNAEVILRTNVDLVDNVPEEDIDAVVLLKISDKSDGGFVTKAIEKGMPTLKMIRQDRPASKEVPSE